MASFGRQFRANPPARRKHNEMESNMASNAPKMATEFTASHSSEYSTTMMATMWQHRLANRYTDLVIKVKDRSISCHRLLLFSACPALEVLVTQATKNLQQQEIHFDDLNPEAVTKTVEFLYGQDVKFSLDSISDVLDANKKFCLVQLNDQIAQFISQTLTTANVLSMWKLSRKHGMEALRRKSITLMSNELTSVGACDKFKELSLEDLCIIMKDKDLKMKFRDDLLVACVEWVDYEPMARKGSMLDILTGVGLEKCSLKTLKTIYKKYQDLLQDVHVLNMILREMMKTGQEESPIDHATSLNTAKSSASCKRNQRSHVKEKAICVDVDGDGDEIVSEQVVNIVQDNDGNVNTSVITISSGKCYVAESLDPFRWKELLVIPPHAICNVPLVVPLDDGFIIFSTYEQGHGTRAARPVRYSAINRTWMYLPQFPRHNISLSPQTTFAVVCNNNVYLCNGTYGSVFRLDLATHTWYVDPHIENAKALAVRGDILYALCKTQQYGNDYHLLEYDTNAPGSSRRLPVPPSTYQLGDNQGVHRMVSIDDSLYVMGNANNRTSAARYHIPSGTWTSLKAPRGSCNCFIHQAGKIYWTHIGDGSTYVRVYDIDTNEWSERIEKDIHGVKIQGSVVQVSWL